MLKLKRNLLSVALASATMLVAAGVQAQTVTGGTVQEGQTGAAQDDASKDARTLDKVTVTGIRAGIENAIDTKESATSIVEAVSAEDIGKLPDQSIAESIARLPGLAAQRVAGRASTISIRGLAENFGTTLLNGREQVSVGHNRGVEFDQYPSELMSAVVVHKTVDASLVGQGLSGTVNLQTIRPLDFSERVINFNVRGEKNSLGELNPGFDDQGFRASASYIDQFLDGKLGVAIGYAHMDSPGQAERWEAWGYPTDNGAARGSYLIGGSKSMAASTENKRDGLMAMIEYKPSDNYSSTLDLYYSEFDKAETNRFLEAGLAWSGATPSNLVIEDGRVVSGTFTGVRPVLRNDLNTQDDKIFAAGWKHKFRFGDHWSLTADASYSKAEREEMLLETYAGLGHNSEANTANVDFVINAATGLPTFTYNRDFTDGANLVLTDPAGWGQAGFVKFPGVEDELTSFRLDAERSFESGIFSGVRFGVNHADREKSRHSGFEGFLRVPNGGLEMAIPGSALNNPADLSFTGIPGTVSYDIMDVFSLYELDEHSHPDIRNKNWTVNEKITTAFAQWDINADLSDRVAMIGNVGLQVVRTDQSSSGYEVPFGEANAPVALSGGATYTDVLPSLNLAFKLPHEQTLRLGLGEQMARPRMDDLRANRNIGIRTDRSAGGEWEGNGGNPELEPWRATALDISYEKYFGGRGYFSLAGFHKDLHSWIRNTSVVYDFSGFDPRAFNPEKSTGYFTRPENLNGGILYGFEAAVSVPFDMLWAPLEGFGVQASYTNNHSRVIPIVGEAPTQLPGLSREVSNITLYYERYGFQARVSQRKRSSFLGEVQGFGGDRSDRYIKGEEILDAQIGYVFGEGTPMEGLSLLLQVNNINNEPYRETFDAEGNLPRMYNEYGRQVLLGASYRF